MIKYIDDYKIALHGMDPGRFGLKIRTILGPEVWVADGWARNPLLVGAQSNCSFA
ncbi:hypothetical protein RE6C_04663 [Rhodopirellula europaea 6C]|uniref:Uncharacterized protein n=1 Tax=Rhodopirellula europaea 6C TaxID=1263867 RepID=M2AXD8_9BACT|nr:hypothetical protein RE6C_04663 [Rhodopirellula europaea 6C]